MGSLKNPLTLELPWPPSINRYYRHVGYKTLIAKEGRDYRATVIAKLTGVLQEPLKDRLKISIECYPPDYRKRDLDNILKALFDSLQHAKIMEDDQQIDEINMIRHEPLPPHGLIAIKIEIMEKKQTQKERQQIVRDYTTNLGNKLTKLVCKLYMAGYTDELVMEKAALTYPQLLEIKQKIQKDLVERGIVVEN